MKNKGFKVSALVTIHSMCYGSAVFTGSVGMIEIFGYPNSIIFTPWRASMSVESELASKNIEIYLISQQKVS
ncbi:hypothetical protein S83_044094 [Arachis hypogaea]